MFNNQKKLIILVLCAILVLISGCSRAPQISKSVSVENFSKYEAKIREISNKYYFSMTAINTDLYDVNDINKGFELLREDVIISVFLHNDALDFEQEGEETFLIAYMLPINENYDLDLFAELVNAVSGEAISTKYCEGFLNHLGVRNKDSRSKKQEFSESKPLNWEANWIISYSLRNTEFPNMYSQELSFSGLTIAMI